MMFVLLLMLAGAFWTWWGCSDINNLSNVRIPP